MKKIMFIIMVSLFVFSCGPQNKIAENKENHEIKPTKNEDDEWELDVLDTQYEYFITAVAKPMSMYSESYLKSRNTFLVTEWNSNFFTGKYRNVIESTIEYNPNENYGLKFEYRLYQVFAYVQWKYGVKMNGLSQTEVR
ncbi:MAG TPA: DUF6146 family protein [Kaistella chaponensis]|uniref:DUF6146 family protein n=1 Tax=Kaistella chaponensis TaxID=713588 RepID=UPI002B64396D|nr:DUF6146 family protein [Kaistella chaponensis]HPW88976.1 DUF6146 family protein [Kaistella chaponensis]HQC06246.1 DUF6146 family protein [Kaistella chaponensis]